jgi:hypothetical protein
VTYLFSLYHINYFATVNTVKLEYTEKCYEILMYRRLGCESYGTYIPSVDDVMASGKKLSKEEIKEDKYRYLHKFVQLFVVK